MPIVSNLNQENTKAAKVFPDKRRLGCSITSNSYKSPIALMVQSSCQAIGL